MNRSYFICSEVRLLIGEGDGTPLQYSCLENASSWMEEPGRLQSMGSLGVGHG